MDEIIKSLGDFRLPSIIQGRVQTTFEIMTLFALGCSLLIFLHNVKGLIPSRFTGSMRTMVISRMSTSEATVPVLEVAEQTQLGSWFAILSKRGYKGNTLPVAIEVAGEKLVAWQNPKTSEWSVMRDECPHRLAPLSQGRVDPLSGCIECPYHGQQFDGKGVCTKIPQSDATEFPPQASAHALPVHSTGDLLWAYMTLPAGQASHYPTLPEKMLPDLLETPHFFTRDLPYSYDFLIENFMDPAHIPFAHHSLQGVRSDGTPLPMKVLTSYDNTTHLEVSYKDVIRGKAREGIVSFAGIFSGYQPLYLMPAV